MSACPWGPGPKDGPGTPSLGSPARSLPPLTFSIFILILSQWLKLRRLALSPVAPTLQIKEKMNQGSISSGMRLSFSGGIFLRPWGQWGQHQAQARTVLSSLRKRGFGGHLGPPLHGLASPQQTGMGNP